MNVTLTERVKVALDALSHEECRRAQAWLDQLSNWHSDQFVRSNSVPLNVQGRNVRMFRTSADIRIFFTVDEDAETITVLDLAMKDTILNFGGAALAREQ